MGQLEQAVSDLQRLSIALGHSLDGHTVGVVLGFLEGLSDGERGLRIQTQTGGVVVELSSDDGEVSASSTALVGCLATLAEG